MDEGRDISRGPFANRLSQELLLLRQTEVNHRVGMLSRAPRDTHGSTPAHAEAFSRTSTVHRDLQVVRTAEKRAQFVRRGIGVRRADMRHRMSVYENGRVVPSSPLPEVAADIRNKIAEPIDTKHLPLDARGRQERLRDRETSERIHWGPEGRQRHAHGQPGGRGRETIPSLERAAARRRHELRVRDTPRLP